MIKKTITYVDFNDEKHTEDFFFNLTQTELAEMEISRVKVGPDGATVSGGMVEVLKRVVAEGEGAKIMKVFKDFLFMAYGQKSPDGKRFIKSRELSDEFAQSAAYDVLFMELMTNSTYAAEFMTALLPAGLREVANQSNAQTARERSEAQMQGFRKPEEKTPSIAKVEDIQQEGTTATASIAPAPMAEEFTKDELEELRKLRAEKLSEKK